MVPKIDKSYMSRSDHSLVTVLHREDSHHRRRSGFQHSTNTANGNFCQDSESEVESDDSDLSEDEDSEEALTRLNRFCWAICCCCRDELSLRIKRLHISWGHLFECYFTGRMFSACVWSMQKTNISM